MSNTIVFIHSAWFNTACWHDFQPYFAHLGYGTMAPSWPLRDVPIADLRAHPSAALAHLGAEEILAHYEGLIRALPESPILIGHSFAPGDTNGGTRPT